jgi:hypothetical protein
MAKDQRSGAQTSEQISEGNTIGGRHVQHTDAARSTQTARNISATELNQTSVSKQTQLKAFGISGNGIYAVVGVVIIAVVFLIVKYAMH